MQKKLNPVFLLRLKRRSHLSNWKYMIISVFLSVMCFVHVNRKQTTSGLAFFQRSGAFSLIDLSAENVYQSEHICYRCLSSS